MWVKGQHRKMCVEGGMPLEHGVGQVPEEPALLGFGTPNSGRL